MQGNPGANVLEIARRTGIPPTSARYHLIALAHAGLLAAWPHGKTKRFFPQDAGDADSWRIAVLLRESALAFLHAWLKDHRFASQRQIILAMQRHGWKRSTTQHRLERLVVGGAASIRRHDQLNLYSANPAPSALTREASPPLHLHALTADNHQRAGAGAWRRDASASRVPPMAPAPISFPDSVALWPTSQPRMPEPSGVRVSSPARLVGGPSEQ